MIENRWRRADGEALERARILDAHACSEGFDVERVRAIEAGSLELAGEFAHVASVIRGEVTLCVSGEELRLVAGVHAYVPPGARARLRLDRGAELVFVSSNAASSSRGREVLVRDETFVSACAAGTSSLRWILTPQYLSRRVFLHHDPILLSRSGHPVSWFHTTMFDVTGLPPNADGEPVFKMAYNSRTEFNVCYAVEGEARVRMAHHPYADRDQAWESWLRLHDDATYLLSEDAVGREHRNKHEVFIANGHVSLFCMFDPAPTGVERHRPGEYSDYEPLAVVEAREEYAVHRRELARFDAMVDRLSLAKARGVLDRARSTEAWATYEEGRAAQHAIERTLIATLAAENKGRERVVAKWIQAPPK